MTFSDISAAGVSAAGVRAAGIGAAGLRDAESGVAIEVAVAGTDTIVLTLQGCLDGEAGRALLEATNSAAAAHMRRVEIVLDQLESFTEDGAAALCLCARLHASVPGGVALRAGGGVGRQALLAACSEVT